MQRKENIRWNATGTLSGAYNKSNYTTTIKCDKVKYKYYGGCGEIELNYDDMSGNFYYNTEPFGHTIYNHKNYDMKISNKNNYLDTTVNYFSNIGDTICKECKLSDVLFNQNESENRKVEIVRSESNEIKQSELKKGLLNFSINSIFDKTRSKDNIKSLTNLIYIDFDKSHNINTINKIPELLKSLDNILFFKKSCRGNGYTAIIPYANNLCFEKVWFSLEDDFKKLGFVVDPSTKNADRVTFYSYDLDYYLNIDCEVYNKELDALKVANQIKYEKQRVIRNDIKKSNISLKNKKSYIDGLVKFLDANNLSLDNGDYSNWERIALGLISEFKENGEFYFLELSKNYNGYNKDEAIEFYQRHYDNYSEDNDVTFGTIVYLAKELGYE